MSIRYTERLAEAGAVGSVGSRGDSYDNTLAESFNWLYEAGFIHRRGTWMGVGHVEWAMLAYIGIFHNRQRCHSALGMSPIGFEARRTPTTTA